MAPNKELRTSIRKTSTFVVLVVPIGCFLCSSICAVPLALVEGWSYGDAFWVIAQELSTAGVPLAEPIPKNFMGRLFAGMVSLISLGFFACILGVLGSSLMDPIYKLFSLDGQASYPRLRITAMLFVGLPALATLLSAVFGGFLAWREGWTFREGFHLLLQELTATRVELLTASLRPAGILPKTLVTLVSLWGLSIYAAVFAVMAGPLCARAMHLDLEKTRSHRECAAIVLLFAGVVLPAGCFLAGLISGAALAWAEGWDFERSFWLSMESLSTSGVPLVDGESPVPGTNLAKAFAAYIGITGLAMFAVILLVAGGELLMPFLRPFGLSAQMAAHHAALAIVVLVLVLLPCLAVAVAVIFGGILCWVEGWAFEASFFILFSDASGCAIPLVDTDELKFSSVPAKVSFVVINLWTLCVAGMAIGVISGPLTEPCLKVVNLVDAGVEEVERSVHVFWSHDISQPDTGSTQSVQVHVDAADAADAAAQALPTPETPAAELAAAAAAADDGYASTPAVCDEAQAAATEPGHPAGTRGGDIDFMPSEEEGRFQFPGHTQFEKWRPKVVDPPEVPGDRADVESVS